ncbi:ribosome silencing factor [Salinicoccus halodurans]|uniref:Ribosomal silencing factor RsfS n=1 Tax=Salinicoccus halodurans TaxID=407035 RepID=A0A0F7HLF7_9STAP|nr:ribosome silencing factor [Salinicoccus halodurans]AKG73942.1 ribosomal silencing factor RsfS [Salinicoccus halodurans]SFK58210.1 ribosome-associated protein [Salinicoccus halodurans]
MKSVQLVQLMIEACDDKRAEDIMKFDVTGSSSVTDYYIICHGTSDRQVQAIADEIKEVAKDNDIEAVVEGYREAKWILCDVNNVVVHVFHKPEREYYNLERLFKNGEHVEV